MDDYPDPDDEFKMMYEEEMENMRMMELEAESEQHPVVKSRRSLDFTSPPVASSSKLTPNYAVASTSSAPDQTFEAFSPVVNRNSQQSLNAGKDLNVSANSQTSSVATGSKLSLKERIDMAASDAETSKRKFNELFGDIDDLNYDDDFDFPSKKVKAETDEELIKRILARRKVNELSLKAAHVMGKGQKQLEEQEHRKSSYITARVPKWPFITLKTKTGDRVYVRHRQEEYYNEAVERVSAKSGGRMELLSVPFATLKRQAEMIIRKKLDDEESAKLDAESDVSIVESIGKEIDSNSQLWVEKYKPHSYMDLLSDEGTNRSLLHWLKLWDKVVFNREKKVRQKAKPFKTEKKLAGNKMNRFSKKPGIVATTENVDKLDENGCPQLKMALLCGPPGLGKTTLAHLIAKHAGYNVVEVNASDERSPEAFRTALIAATQMRSVLGEKKPNCLVLDEIDGAPAASIEMLVKFATGKDTGQGRGKKKGRATVLKRPIICICNDIYVPALRSLRLISFVVKFPPTLASRLAQRLLEIARKQDIKTDLGVLLAMAEKSQNDIRSCVSLLHFLKNKGKGQAEVKMNDVMQASIGQRDVQKGLFTVWQEIFQIQRPKRGHSGDNGRLVPMPDLDGPVAQFGDMSLSTRMRNILHTVQSCGDYDRLGQGVFENYPLVNIKDSSMEGIVDSLEWFCVSDVLHRSIYGEQNYFLMAYLPFAFVAHHFNFASLAWPKLHYPSAGYENSVKETRSKSILKDVLRGMTPKVRTYTNGQQLVLDTLPILLDLLVPQLRPVSTQLYSLREKEELKQVISTMIDFNLNYVQERTPEGAYVYHLEPNIEELCQFPSSEVRASRVLPYSGKQLLSQEIELEKMRRAEAGRQLGELSATPAVSTAPKASDAPAAVPSHLQKLVPKPVVLQTDPGMMKDFFGRVVPCSQIVGNTTKTDEIVKSDIWFHFKEGFSNAVRKSVKIKDLL